MRFQVRDVFWLMAAVGLILGWWSDRSRLAREVAEAIQEVSRLSKEIKTCDREVELLKRSLRHREEANLRLVKYINQGFGSATAAEIQQAMEAAIRRADERYEQGLLPEPE